jgi:organic hydroperoxide reductase OsmC/OhrA
MSEHTARVRWRLTNGDFLRGTYSREHVWEFDGGVTVPASASPSVVRAPYSSAEAVDPEEAFVASISSCHMLTFLYYAGREKVAVVAYEDHAVGTLTKNEAGVPWVSAVVLDPRVTYGDGSPPTPEQVRHLHHLAHTQCFIANSVKTDISLRDPGCR